MGGGGRKRIRRCALGCSSLVTGEYSLQGFLSWRGEGKESYPTMCTMHDARLWSRGNTAYRVSSRVGGGRRSVSDVVIWMPVSGHGVIQLTGFLLVGGRQGRLRPCIIEDIIYATIVMLVMPVLC